MKLDRSTAHILRPLPLLALVAAAVRLGVRHEKQKRLFAETGVIARNEAVKRRLAASEEK